MGYTDSLFPLASVPIDNSYLQYLKNESSVWRELIYVS